MIQIGNIKIGRCGYKIVIGNISNNARPIIARLGTYLRFVEFSVALVGVIFGAFGVISIVSFLLAILLFIEIISFDMSHQSTVVQSQEHGGEGATWDFDPPLEFAQRYYVDKDGGIIPQEEEEVACSDHVKIEIPRGAYKNLDESGYMIFGLPTSANKITIVKDWQQSESSDIH